MCGAAGLPVLCMETGPMVWRVFTEKGSTGGGDPKAVHVMAARVPLSGTVVRKNIILLTLNNLLEIYSIMNRGCFINPPFV